jgi:hypothetical protein
MGGLVRVAVEEELRAEGFLRREGGGAATKAFDREHKMARRGTVRALQVLLGLMIALRAQLAMV